MQREKYRIWVRARSAMSPTMRLGEPQSVLMVSGWDAGFAVPVLAQISPKPTDGADE
jgi:hypothetical protein